MAHEALQKGDIVYSICAVLTDRSDSGTLARLARVDRLFNECATPALWRRLRSLLPLFKMFSCFWKIGSGGDQTLSYEIYVSIDTSSSFDIQLIPRFNPAIERHLNQ